VAAPELRGDHYLHDPSSLVHSRGEYVVYASHDGLQAHTSPNRVQWSLSPVPAFPRGVPWVADYTKNRDTKDMWAPDVSWVGGTYWMFFAASQWGSRRSAIGATLLLDIKKSIFSVL
jgi:arabinan endo-1,5-alpha-L-arabinosidase